jgi:hypothetical protein
VKPIISVYADFVGDILYFRFLENMFIFTWYDDVCPDKGHNNFSSGPSVPFLWADVSVQAPEPYGIVGSADVL